MCNTVERFMDIEEHPLANAEQSIEGVNEKPTFKQKLKKSAPLIRFLSVFIILIAAYYLAVLYIDKSIFDSYIHLNASISAFLLNIFGTNASSVGSLISSPEFSISLAFGCEGSEPIVLFLSALFAFPIGVKLKIPGFLLGTSLLFFLNQIRIVGLYYIGLHYNKYFETFHVEIFPILFIIIAIIFWGAWIRWALKKSGKLIKR